MEFWKPESVIKHLKTRSKLSDGLPTFFGAKTSKLYRQSGINDVLKPDEIPKENDFKSSGEHKPSDSGYSTPNRE